jgi:hypothetical protein
VDRRSRGLVLLVCLITLLAGFSSRGALAAARQTPAPAPAAPATATAAQASAFELVNTLGGEITTSVLSGTLAYLGLGAGLTIVDVSTPPNITLRGTLVLPAKLEQIFLRGTRLYAHAESGLLVIDVSDPARPTLLADHRQLSTPQGTIALDGDHLRDVLVRGSRAYLLLDPTPLDWDSRDTKLRVVDLANPQALVLQGSFGALADARLLDLDAGHLVIADLTNPSQAKRLLILDVANPNAPTVYRDYRMTNVFWINEAALRGSTLYLNTPMLSDYQLGVYSITSPTALAMQDHLSSTLRMYGLKVEGELAAFCTSSSLQLLDVGDPLDLQVHSTTGLSSSCTGTSLSGARLLLEHDQTGTISLYTIAQPAQPAPEGSYGQSGTIVSLSASGSVIYTYAGLAGGLGTLDATSPATPTLAGYNALTNSRPVLVEGAVGYTIHAPGPLTLRTLDLTQPLSPTLLATQEVDDVYLEDWAVDQQQVYVLGSSLTIVDASDPLSPTIAGTYGYDQGGAFSANALAVKDGIVYIPGLNQPLGECELMVLDANDPQNIDSIAQIDLPDCGWTSMLQHENMLYMMLQNHLVLVDISVPSSPVLRGSNTLPPTSTFESGMVLQGDYLYIGYASAIHAFDIANPAAPRRLAVFDLHYPITDLDLVGDLLYVSNLDQGLRIVRLQPAQLVAGRIWLPLVRS